MDHRFRVAQNRRRMIRAAALALAAVLASLASPAAAQSWPSKPIRIVTPFPPGGPSDIIARAMAEKLVPALGQPVVVENKPGAGGNIGTAEVARASADGHTWLLGTDTVLTVNPTLYKKTGFRAADLLPVSTVTVFSQMLVCHPSTNVRTLGELVARAKARPLTYASGGHGVPGHLAMEMLLAAAGIDMTHVPYKGPAPAMQDVMAGEVPCGFLAGPTVLPQVRAGKLVALAVSGARRSPLAPEVPTVAEAGYPGYDATFALVLYLPRGTPEPVLAAVHRAMGDALRQPDVGARARATDQEVAVVSPAEAAGRLAADTRKWGEVMKRIDLQID